MRTRVVVGCVVFLALPLIGFPRFVEREALLATSRAPIRLGLPGRASATPSIAARGDFVVVAWGASLPQGGGDVFVSVSRDAARSFAEPVRVDARIGEARLGGELPPRVALGPARSGDTPAIHVTWGARASLRESALTEIRTARSVDGGRTFEKPAVLNAEGAGGDRGWHATAMDPRGVAHAVWLDHRAIPSRKPGEAHVHGTGVDMSQMSGLYYAGAGPGSERELTRGVCYCCKTALVVSDEGAIYAAWRHVYPGSIRDIAFTMSADGGRTFAAPARVSVDNWTLAGCPDDGPAIALDREGPVHIVWPTVIDGPAPEGAIFYASTRDGSRFTPRVRVPTLGGPKPSHPQILADGDGSLVVAWDEAVGGMRRAAVRRVTFDRTGLPVFGEVQGLGGEGGAFPVMAASSRGILAAWTRGSGVSSHVVVDVID
jgi:hypothetical protein